MANISTASIKKLIREYFDADITEDGAEEMAKVLSLEAKKISKFAVNNAKKEKREKVTKKDIMEYVYKGD